MLGSRERTGGFDAQPLGHRAYVVVGDGADLADRLRDDQVGRELGEQVLVERVEGLAAPDKLANAGVDLGGGEPGVEDAAGQVRKPGRLGRKVALVRDRDHVIAQAEREQRLGGRGDEAGDTHRPNLLRDGWSRVSPVARLTDEEIDAKLGELDGWSRAGEAITKTFERGDFVGSVRFVDALVDPAEEMGHHPDLEISWDKVKVTVTTHSEGGLTANDFELAGRIENLA